MHISANMSLFGLKFAQMILHTETSKLMYNLSFLFVVLHKPTLLPSTFKMWSFSYLRESWFYYNSDGSKGAQQARPPKIGSTMFFLIHFKNQNA